VPTANGQPPPTTSPLPPRDTPAHERLALLVHASADAIIGETLEGIITDWNPAAERLYGYTAAEVIGQHRTLLTPPGEADAVSQRVARLQHGESIEGLETVRWTKDGRRLDVALTLSPIRDGGGTVVGTSITVRDITARKATERALASSEALFRTVFANAPIGMLVASPELQVLRVNRALCAMLGYPEDELLAIDFWQLTHPDDREPNRTAMQRALAGDRETYALQKRYVHKDGHLVWGHLHGSLVRDATGAPLYFVSQIEDITERLAVDEERARLAAIVASAEDAIISSTREGNITSWNAGAERLFGFRATEMIGQSFTLLLPDDLHDLTLARRSAALAGESVAPFETTRRRRDGTTFAASLALSPIRDRNDQVIGISSITRDMTERNQLERELRAALAAAQAANEAKTQFLAMISHELRTPLQAILGYAEFLLADSSSTLSPDEREDLGYIQQGGQRMLSLMTQLLDLSRMEAGRLDVARRPVALGEVLEAVRQDVAPHARQKGLTLRTEVGERLPPVLGDADRLRQILLNVVGNAVKFTEQGTIEVTAATEAMSVVVQVRDTGIGIPPEDLPQIFEAFRQVERHLVRPHGGAGLGLAIAQKLAALMGGGITVESALGVGSTFSLVLPAVPPPP
jgi:PAS domain S-box-containing protein